MRSTHFKVVFKNKFSSDAFIIKLIDLLKIPFVRKNISIQIYFGGNKTSYNAKTSASVKDPE